VQATGPSALLRLEDLLEVIEAAFAAR